MPRPVLQSKKVDFPEPFGPMNTDLTAMNVNTHIIDGFHGTIRLREVGDFEDWQGSFHTSDKSPEAVEKGGEALANQNTRIRKAEPVGNHPQLGATRSASDRPTKRGCRTPRLRSFQRHHRAR